MFHVDTTDGSFVTLVLFGILSFYYFSHTSTSLIRYIARKETYDERKISLALRWFCTGMALATIPGVCARDSGHPWLSGITIGLYFAILFVVIHICKKGLLRQSKTSSNPEQKEETEKTQETEETKNSSSKKHNEFIFLCAVMVIIAILFTRLIEEYLLFGAFLLLFINLGRYK